MSWAKRACDAGGGTQLALAAVMAAALMLGGCGGEAERGADADRFGPVVSSVDDIVGTEVRANAVVSMPCIPSRRDPVGVWLGMRVVAADIGADIFTLDLQSTEARLGSHPSGCSQPDLLLAQSVFLFDGTDAVFAAEHSGRSDVTSLVFVLDGRSQDDFDLVILPTFAFLKGDGVRETTIFGLIGRYSIA